VDAQVGTLTRHTARMGTSSNGARDVEPEQHVAFKKIAIIDLVQGKARNAAAWIAVNPLVGSRGANSLFEILEKKTEGHCPPTGTMAFPSDTQLEKAVALAIIGPVLQQRGHEHRHQVRIHLSSLSSFTMMSKPASSAARYPS
jgi:hypothetical protein